MRSAYVTEFVDVAVDQERQESAVEQIAVASVVFERFAVIGGGGGGVALLAGMTGSQIAPCAGQPGKVLRGRRLGGKLERRRHQECGKRGADNAPAKARRSHWQCSNEAIDRGFSREPPRLGREWPFCAAPARTAVAALRQEVENLDVAAS